MASSSRSKASTKGRPQPKRGKKTAVRPSRLLTRRRPIFRATSPESIGSGSIYEASQASVPPEGYTDINNAALKAVLNAHITPFTQLPETVRAELMDSTCPGAVISASFSMDWNLDADSGCMANPALGEREDSAEEEAPGRSHSKLPAKLGGLGLLSFKDVAPLAYRSACESADKLLGTLSLIPATEEPPPPTTQRSWCAELWDAQRDAILLGLNDTQRKRLTENASKLGRSWLSTIPLYQPLRLSDIDIASALHGRTLVGSSVPICRLLMALSSKSSPPTLSGQRRNDLRIRGTSSLPFTDYDLKVLSLGDNKARSTAVPHPPNSKLADSASTGGLTSHETADELKAWREAMPEGVFLRQQRRISVELVKARARTLVL
ncbi:hypothetical protein LQV05_001191 [Cryptococcus neoformans]|nr:hypothetical protein LQV05_001191 [Cryptococcus neoformans]